MQTAKDKTAGALDAVNPDLTPFRARGGKLILYHGWDDPAIPAVNTVNYYARSSRRWGRRMRIRLCGCTWFPACSIAVVVPARVILGNS